MRLLYILVDDLEPTADELARLTAGGQAAVGSDATFTVEPHSDAAIAHLLDDGRQLLAVGTDLRPHALPWPGRRAAPGHPPGLEDVGLERLPGADDDRLGPRPRRPGRAAGPP